MASGPVGSAAPLTAAEVEVAEAARGFMPADEGLALATAAAEADPDLGPFLEVGSYCGKSGIYIGSAAQVVIASCVVTNDHAR